MEKIIKKPLSILLISDFFYPKVGGVEVHIYQLAVSLIRLGCKVTVLTHHRKNRQGKGFVLAEKIKAKRRHEKGKSVKLSFQKSVFSKSILFDNDVFITFGFE